MHAKNAKQPTIIFAGDRDLSVWVLKFLLERGVKPVALLVSSEKKASHANEIRQLCSHLDASMIFEGKDFREPDNFATLAKLQPDYIIGIHFPYIIDKASLKMPNHGVINLHPAFLPFNRGWHTPSWALLDHTPYGATLHFMDEGIDTGDIIHQKQIEVQPDDTANTLYQKVKQLEFEVFKEAWPSLANFSYVRTKQDPSAGTEHQKKDLAAVQQIDEDEIKLIEKLRALTTNTQAEAAYFEMRGVRYFVQVTIQAENK
jgi:methionyl-tRNA formyltransferase